MTFGLNHLDVEMQQSIADQLTLQELHNAAIKMKLEKAPGIDGLTLELYLRFWDILGPLILLWFGHTMALGRLTGTSGLGVISLFPKTGDPRVIQNWRPIMLLTVEMKIVCKAIATRLMQAVASITSQNQTAITGSSIFTSLSIIRDIVSLNRSVRQPFYILSLDQTKAFDKVNHKFLFHILETIRLPEFLLKSIRTLYSGFQCMIKNGGALSKPFPYNRGIRQGDATSTALYTLAIQPALNALQLVLFNEGIRLPSGDNVLHTTYADDVTMFIRSPAAIRVVIDTFNKISTYSEAVLNLPKSAVMCIDYSKKDRCFTTESTIYGIPLMSTSIKILGIDFTAGLTISDAQWTQKILSTRDTLLANLAFLTKLTYLDRAQWARRKLWPRWSFLLKVLQPSSGQISQLTSLFTEVIWLGAKHWLSPDVLSADILHGGIDLLIPQQKIDVMRVNMLVNLHKMSNDRIQLQLAKCLLQKYAGLGFDFELLHMNFDQKESFSIPAVYRSALAAWERLPTCIFPHVKDDILGLPAISSKVLLQLEEPIVISPSLAIYLGVRTIQDVCNLPLSSSRTVLKLISNVKKMMEQWELPPWPSGDVTSFFVQDPSYVTSSHHVRFYLQHSNGVVPIEKWTNTVISKVIKGIRNSDAIESVPGDTWKILFRSVAPSTFKNYMWRFLHGAITTPTYYCHTGLIHSLNCVLCGSMDVSQQHQFSTCPMLSETIAIIQHFKDKLGLPLLQDYRHLYPSPLAEHKLANFMVLAFVYAVLQLTRCAVNNSVYIDTKVMKRLYFSVINKHFNYFAINHPPHVPEERHSWDVFTHGGILACFKQGVLYIRDSLGFRPFVHSQYSV